MKFSKFNRLITGTIITLKNTEGITGVENINYFIDDSKGNIKRKEYRWSFDTEYWSSWENLTQTNLSGLLSYGNLYLFLEARYEFVGAISSINNVTSLTLDYVESSLTLYDASSPTSYDLTVTKYRVVPVNDSSLLNSVSGSYYLNRTNHTGSQPISSITGLSSILSSLSTGTITTIGNIDVCTGSLGSANIFSYISSNTAHFKKIVVEEGINITEDASYIKFSLAATNYKATFVADTSSYVYYPSSLHGLGTGPFSISLYENDEQVYVTNTVDNNGNVTLSWVEGNLSGLCSVVITS